MDITPGAQAATLPITVHNPNARPLRITSAQTAAPYAITADACLAHPAPPGGSCIITVQFAPTALGQSMRILTVGSAAGVSTAQLSGTGDAVLTVSITGSGSISDGSTINCTSGTCSEQIQTPLTVTLTATPGPGDVLKGWEGDCQGAGSNVTCQVTIAADTNVSAYFEINN